MEIRRRFIIRCQFPIRICEGKKPGYIKTQLENQQRIVSKQMYVELEVLSPSPTYYYLVAVNPFDIYKI